MITIHWSAYNMSSSASSCSYEYLIRGYGALTHAQSHYKLLITQIAYFIRLYTYTNEYCMIT
jgi:hypothetical protein